MKKRVFRRLGGKRRGFTLIELLSILAVLAAVVVLALTGFIGRGESAACEADENAIQTAIYSYYYESGGNWPTTAGTVADAGTDIDWTKDHDGGKLVPDYLNERPNSDWDGTNEKCNWAIKTGGVVCWDGTACGCGTACPTP
ncbi:hypothetical protein ES703_06203 [subsurface metagenome]